jgi:hypothetical protein
MDERGGRGAAAFDNYYVVATTDKAVLVKESEDASDKTAVWLPKSQMDIQSGDVVRSGAIDFEIPQWLAEKSGLW